MNAQFSCIYRNHPCVSIHVKDVNGNREKIKNYESFCLNKPLKMSDCGNQVDGACAQKTESLICCVPSNSLCTIHSASTCSLPAFALKSVAQDPEFLQVRKTCSGRSVKKVCGDPKPRFPKFKPEVPIRRATPKIQRCKTPCCYPCCFSQDLQPSECLDSLLQVLKSRVSTMEEIHHFWTCYEVQAMCGPHVKNLVLLSEIVDSIGGNMVNTQLDPKFVYKIIGHLRRGIRVQSLSENGNVEVIVKALDQFAKTLVTASDHICIAILGMVLQWFRIYRDQDILMDEASLEPATQNPKPRRKSGPKAPSGQNRWDTMPEASGDFNRLQVHSRQEALLNGSTFCKALDHSILASVLERLVTSNVSVKNRFLYVRVLQTLKFMCENSYYVRTHLLKTQLVTATIAKLESLSAAPPVLEATIDLYFALVLEGVPNAESLEVSPDAFGYLFELLLDATSNVKNYGKALRNQIALVTLSIGRLCPSVVAATALEPYAKDIAAILSDNILGCEIGKVAATAVLTWNKEDLQLIQNLVWLLGLVIGDGRLAKAIEEHETVKALLTLAVSGPEALEGRKTGAEADLVEYIRKAARRVLKDFLNKAPSDVVERAASIVSETLDCSSKCEWGDQAAIEMASIAALQVIKRAPKGSQDFLSGVLALLEKLTPDGGYGAEQEATICNALSSISALAASGDEELLRMIVDSDAIILLVRLMHLIIYPYEKKSSSLLEVAVAECIWACVSNSASAQEIFVTEEGVPRLLDLLEVASSSLAKCKLLGTLLHLCQDKKCLSQTIAWERRLRNLELKSPGSEIVSENKVEEFQADQTLCALLCEIWREEEAETGVLRTKMGVIASSTYPLMTEFGRNLQARKGASKTNVEGETSVRPKIAVLLKLMVDTNRETAIFAGLSRKNQLTMQIVLNYVDLKKLEIYRQLWLEMQEEGMELIQSDRDQMIDLIDLYENKVNAVKHTQEYLILRANEENVAGEQELYRGIRKSQMEDLLEFLKKAEQGKKGDSGGYFLLVDKRVWNSSEMGIVPEEMPEPEVSKSVKFDEEEGDQVESESVMEEGAGDGGPDKPADGFVNSDDGLGPTWVQKMPIHVPTQIGISINRMRASSVPPVVLEKQLRKLQAEADKMKTKSGGSDSSRLVKKKWKRGSKLESNFEFNMSK